MTLEQGDLVLCVVERISETTVFVKIEGSGEGSISMSEVAAGRIRNLREYVVPKKRIVCKVLRIHSNGNVELSLRRVTLKEQKEMLEKDALEKTYRNIIKSILAEKSEQVIQKINEKNTLVDFFNEAKVNLKLLDEFFTKEDAKKIATIIQNQKKKIVKLKKEILLSTKKSNGILAIKEILKDLKGISIHYLAAGHYVLEKEGDDLKSADQALRDAANEIEKRAKKEGIEYASK